MIEVAEKYKGMFWHVHHDKLMEWSNDIRERIDYIKKEKPKNEVETRLRLMQKVKGKIPAELKEAYAKLREVNAKWEEADAKLREAYAKLEEADAKLREVNAKLREAYAKLEEADAKLREADAKREEAYAKSLPGLEKLHAEECGCKEWNGKELVFR